MHSLLYLFANAIVGLKHIEMWINYRINSYNKFKTKLWELNDCNYAVVCHHKKSKTVSISEEKTI